MTFRSRKLLDACRLLPCSHCGAEDGTVVAAHGTRGKGMALKAPDHQIASLCYACHMALDQGSKMSKEERREMWTEAHLRTIAALFERGIIGVK
jgi:hypothetical protein